MDYQENPASEQDVLVAIAGVHKSMRKALGRGADPHGDFLLTLFVLADGAAVVSSLAGEVLTDEESEYRAALMDPAFGLLSPYLSVPGSGPRFDLDGFVVAYLNLTLDLTSVPEALAARAYWVEKLAEHLRDLDRRAAKQGWLPV